MYSFISGKVVEKNPAFVVIENNGIGYLINITLNTYDMIGEQSEVKLYVYLAIREDAHTLYGFYEPTERELFLLLQTVSGVGCTTARILLSSLTVREAVNAIADGDLRVLKGVKGIGAKTAERIIVDLRDKVMKLGVSEGEKSSSSHNKIKEEALYALMVLGFGRAAVDKVLDKLLETMEEPSVEKLVKEGLRML